MGNTRRLRKFDLLLWSKPCAVITIDKKHVTFQDDIDHGIIRRHRDNLKKLSNTFTIKNNIPDRNSSVGA